MTRDDSSIVDAIFADEGEEERRGLSAEELHEVDALRSTLATMRTLEEAEPSPHLDALILAHARQAAEKEPERSIFAKWSSWFGSSGSRLLLASTAAGVLVVATASTVLLKSASRSPEQQLAYDMAPPASPTAKSLPAAESIAKPEEKARLPQDLSRRRDVQDEAKEDRRAEAWDDDGREPEVATRAKRKRPRPADKELRAQEATEGDFEGSAADVAAAPPSPADEAVAQGMNRAATGGAGQGMGSARAVSPSRSAPAAGRVAEPVQSPTAPRPSTAQKAEESEVTSDGAPQSPSGAKAESASQTKLADDASSEMSKKGKGASPAKPTAATAGEALGGATERDSGSNVSSREQTGKRSSTSGPGGQAVRVKVLARAEAAITKRAIDDARKILTEGLEATQGSADYPWIALRLAELELREKRFAEARTWASAALEFPAFPRRKRALEVRKLASESQPSR